MTIRHRILLLNPPAAKPVFRDCYCSGRIKGPLFVNPLDLQMQSGYFPVDKYRVGFIDAVFERLSPDETLRRVRVFEPDTVLSLVGHASMGEDAPFLGRLKSCAPESRLFLSGDVVRFTPAEVFKRTEAEGLLTDFSSSGLADHLAGNRPFDLMLRDGTFDPRPPAKGFDYPLPHPCTVRKYGYKLPFFAGPRFYSLATSFGCPFRCGYCNTHLLGYRERPVASVIRELAFAAGLGFRSLYIRDATFLYDRERTLRLFSGWEETGLRFQWMCFTRPELICREVAERASRLGCRLMMVGVETFDERCLRGLSRTTTAEAAENGFSTLRECRIPSAAQIIVGLEGSSGPDLRGYEYRLRRLLARIDPDYVSLNIFSPRPGVPADHPDLRRLEENRAALERLAVRVGRRFYLRPASVFRGLRSIGSPAQLALQLRVAANLI